jgi:hypothetical protein
MGFNRRSDFSLTQLPAHVPKRRTQARNGETVFAESMAYSLKIDGLDRDIDPMGGFAKF